MHAKQKRTTIYVFSDALTTMCKWDRWHCSQSNEQHNDTTNLFDVHVERNHSAVYLREKFQIDKMG